MHDFAGAIAATTARQPFRRFGKLGRRERAFATSESGVFHRFLAAGDPFPNLVVGDDERGLNLPVEKRQRLRFDRWPTRGRTEPRQQATASPAFAPAAATISTSGANARYRYTASGISRAPDVDAKSSIFIRAVLVSAGLPTVSACSDVEQASRVLALAAAPTGRHKKQGRQCYETP